MSATDSPSVEVEPSACFFCGKAIVDGQWFARLKQGSRRVIFCRPYCVEMYLQQSASALPEWSLIRTNEV